MKIFDEQLYTFLTRPENFEPFADLQGHYNKVRERLINDFWDLVHQEVLRRRDEVSDWEITLEAKGIDFRKLRATHGDAINTDSRSKIVYEFLDSEVILGVWIDRGRIGIDKLRKIWEAATEFVANKHPWQPGNGGLWYTIQKRPGLNLQHKSSLMEILPAKREALAMQYAADFILAIQQLGPFCLKQAKNC